MKSSDKSYPQLEVLTGVKGFAIMVIGNKSGGVFER